VAVGLALIGASGYGVFEYALILGPPVFAEQWLADRFPDASSGHRRVRRPAGL
jgi:hypothetical protein